MRSATNSTQENKVLGGFTRPFCGYALPEKRPQMLLVADVSEVMLLLGGVQPLPSLGGTGCNPLPAMLNDLSFQILMLE